MEARREDRLRQESKYKPRASRRRCCRRKVVKIDRLEWIAISDPLTAVKRPAAGRDRSGRNPGARPLPVLKADKNIAPVRLGTPRAARSSCASTYSSPFNNVKARQAAMYAIAQRTS